MPLDALETCYKKSSWHVSYTNRSAHSNANVSSGSLRGNAVRVDSVACRGDSLCTLSLRCPAPNNRSYGSASCAGIWCSLVNHRRKTDLVAAPPNREANIYGLRHEVADWLQARICKYGFEFLAAVQAKTIFANSPHTCMQISLRPIVVPRATDSSAFSLGMALSAIRSSCCRFS